MSLCINPQCAQSANSDRMLFCQSCGSELLLAGKYRVDQVMSKKGGFGDTYEVTERGVLKVLKLLKSNNDKAIELFDREYRVLESLAGEGIAGVPLVEDFFLYTPNGTDQALHCLVMERIFGMDLEEYIKVMKKPIDQKTATSWLSQLTQILEEIHRRGILHRDIKPSNIILQPDGQLVLIDFGAVKEAAANATGQNHTRIYTPGYAAPEQQRGEASNQSDFYSIGRTFVYLLTCKEPTDLYDSYRDALVWRDKTIDVSNEYLDLIDRLMQETPQQRPETTTTIFQEIAVLPAITTRLPTGIATAPARSTVRATMPSSSVMPQMAAPIAINPVTSTTPVKSPKTPKKFVLIAIGLAALLSLAALATYFFRENSPSSSVSRNNTGRSVGEAFTEIKDVPTGTFKFGGSTTWATTRQLQSSVDAAIKGVYPKYDIVYADASSPDFKSTKNGKCESKPGSNTGICWLLEGDLDFAQSSIALAKSKFKDDDRVKANQLKQEAVAFDALSVIVNPQLKVTGLTIEQLRDIYTGKATNWNQVGGPDLPIIAYSREESSGGTVSSFKDLVLQKGDTFKFQPVSSPTAGLQQVGKNPGGIYYGAAKEVIVDSCNTKPIAIGKTATDLVKPYQEPLQSPAACNAGQRNKINTTVVRDQTYPLTRQIYVIIKTNDADRQKAGEAYANLLKTKQGQELLEKAGFISLDR
jgi:serine/threonine protein kinase